MFELLYVFNSLWAPTPLRVLSKLVEADDLLLKGKLETWLTHCGL